MIDEAQAKRIAKQYYNDVYRFCLSRVNKDEASDITQEVFLLFQEKCDFLEDDNICSWLISVAEKKSFEAYRKRKKEKEILENVSIIENAFTTIEEYFNVNEKDIAEAKSEVFSQLTEKEKRLFELIYTQKLKYAAIAEELKTTEKAVSMSAVRLNRKIKRLVAETAVDLCMVLLNLIFLKIF